MSRSADSAKESVQAKIRIDPGGRIVIPVEMRKELCVRPGDTLVMGIVDGALHIESFDKKLARIQDEIIRLVGPGRSLSDELIAEHREEVRREFEKEERTRLKLGTTLRKAG
jgi:bifunctional DNA-binding transcriptional regulator/antitoxin component of YhaV-PrlF toxin-antitoxin module